MLTTIVAISVVLVAFVSLATFVSTGVRLKKLRGELRSQNELRSELGNLNELLQDKLRTGAHLSPELEQTVISDRKAVISDRIHQLKTRISAARITWILQKGLRRELQTHTKLEKELRNLNELVENKLRSEARLSPELEQTAISARQAAISERIDQLEARIPTTRNLMIGSGVAGLSSFGLIGLSFFATLSERQGPPAYGLIEPAWNVWAEQPSETVSFEPDVDLKTRHKYSLIVNLSAIAFDRFERAGVHSQKISSGFERWLEENNQVDSAEVKLHVYPDTQYFLPQAKTEKVKTLRLNLARMRRSMRTGVDLNGSPLKILQRERDDADFNFGVSSFRIETSSRSGVGSIAIAIWANGRALDELSVSLCIKDGESNTCVEPPTQSGSLNAIDLTFKRKSEYPDATLQLMARGAEVVGEFRCEICEWPEDRYDSWVIPESKTWLSDQFKSITQRIGKASISDKAFRKNVESAGKEIYNVVFHSRDPGVARAQASFGAFIHQARAGAKQSKTARTLFVKLVTGEHELILPPIALMRVPLLSNTAEFVGFNVKVQTPLEYQDYSSPGKCISDWLLFVPPYAASPPLPLKDVSEAREAFGERWINGFKQSCPSCVVEKEEDFQQWLGHGEPENHAVVILSHHKQNALYLNEVTGQPEILSSDITRDFASPSLVILDACGTFEPGASEFVRAFNFHRVNTVIATTTQVEPLMAGTFLAMFMNALQQHANEKEYTVSDARFDTVRDMGEPEDSPYGPKALVFVLAGNDAVKLCLPSDSVKQATSPK